MTDPERSHTFFPGGQISEAGFRYANLYPYIVKLLSMAYSGEHPQPPPRFYPQSFDEIYSMREQLAAFNISMGRDRADQKAYYAFIKTAGNPEQLIIEKYFGGENSIPNDRRFAIVPNDYPATMPPGVSHLLMWYIDKDLPNTWVGNKISEYIEGQKLTTGDFVIYRKPDNSGPFVPGFSRSKTLPHVHLLIRDNGIGYLP